MLRVLPSEHRANFRELIENSDSLLSAVSRGEISNQRAAALLSFYAAEVGLKYLLNTVLKVPFKHETPGKNTVESYSHDLPKMVADLKVPAARVPVLPKQYYSCIGGYDDGSGGQRIQMHQAHEAWRYGLTVEQSDETALVTYVTGIIAYLKQEIAP